MGKHLKTHIDILEDPTSGLLKTLSVQHSAATERKKKADPLRHGDNDEQTHRAAPVRPSSGFNYLGSNLGLSRV